MNKSFALHPLTICLADFIRGSILCSRHFVIHLPEVFLGFLVFLLAVSTASNAQPTGPRTLQGSCPVGLKLGPGQGCTITDNYRIVRISKDPKDDELEAPVAEYIKK